MDWPRVSIVVVTHNSEPHIAACVRSLLSQGYPAFDLTLVDNASDDGTRGKITNLPKDVRTHRLPHNIGFAAACNLGLRATEAEYVALVNPDVQVTRDWLFPIIEEMENDKTIAAAMPKIYRQDSEKRINSDGGRLSFLGFAWSGHNGLRDDGDEETVEVPYASGAAVVLRRAAVDEVGRFDPSYFLYHEDVDLGVRLWRAGFRCVCVRRASASHDYEPWRHPEKIAYVEENRWATLAKNFSSRSLVRALPFLLLAEALVLGYCLRRGWLRLKVAAVARFLRRFGPLLEERRRLATQLGDDDGTILRLCEGSLEEARPGPDRFTSLDALFRGAYESFLSPEPRATRRPGWRGSWDAIASKGIWLVASHGGHLSELFDMLAYDPERMLLVTYDSARTREIPGALRLSNIGRNPWRLFATFLLGIVALFRSRPKLVVSTGAEIAVPILLGAWLLGTSTIYIEPCTRVRRPTLTGKILYPFSTLFLVQSEELLPRFGPRAIYRGGLV